ncbi:MAG: hypothetical protein IKR19_03660 [Acholeplasmatales bacterium]|nr:hypothetical protein [Acholeplasmatales bacterium]
MSSKYECPNCGYDLNQSERECKYCGSLNQNFVAVNHVVPQRNTPSILNQTNNNNQSNQGNTKTSTPQQNSFGCLIFVLLLIFCWPAAIVYLIVKGLAK